MNSQGEQDEAFVCNKLITRFHFILSADKHKTEEECECLQVCNTCRARVRSGHDRRDFKQLFILRVATTTE